MHICALENKESCARVLLFRGVDRTLTNYANQTAYDVAILTNHLDVALLLNDFTDSLITPFSHQPAFTARKRLATLSDRGVSPSPSTTSSVKDTTSICSDPPSPGPLVKSLHTASTPANMHTLGLVRRRKTSTGSLPETAEEYSESDSDSDDENHLKPAKQNRTFSNGGIGTQRSPAPMKITSKHQHLRTRLYASVPGRNFVAIEDYKPTVTGELTIKKGDIVDVLYVGEGGFWEGTVKGRAGWFPSRCVQEVKKGDSLRGKPHSWLNGRKKSLIDNTMKAMNTEAPVARNVTLYRADKGFGFQLRGANSHVTHIDFNPTPQFPALQYIGDVDKGGVAEKAGLHPGDFVLEINSENVIKATHGYAVSLISKGSNALCLKVITVAPETGVGMGGNGPETSEVNGAPPPPLRASSTVLSIANGNDDSVLSEGRIAPNPVETVVLETSKERQASAKGMWSGNAYRLQGDDSGAHENISSGIGRKQSNEVAAKFDERLKNMTQPVTIDRSAYPVSEPFRRSVSEATSIQHLRNNSSLSTGSNNDVKSKRKATPPGYDHTIDNMRRGRTNSLGRGDNARPDGMLRSATMDLDKKYKENHNVEVTRRNNPPTGMRMATGNTLVNNRHTMYHDVQYNTYDPRRNILPDRHQHEPLHYPSARRFNRNDPQLNANHPNTQFRDTRNNNMRRPQSEVYSRDMVDHQMQEQQQQQQQQHLYAISNQQRKQETVLEKNQRKYLMEPDYHRNSKDTQPKNAQEDGLIRSQNIRNQTPPTANIIQPLSAPVAPPSGALPPPPPPPPPPAADYSKDESSSALGNSIADAVAARSVRVKNKMNGDTDGDVTRLYNSGSSASLDSSSSKDSGFDTSTDDHSSALMAAIAARAAKISSKEPPSTMAKPLAVTKAVPQQSIVEETSLVKPSDMLKQLRITNINSKNDLNANEIDNGYSSPTSNRPRCKSELPPPVSMKPKRSSTVSALDKKSVLTEDIATAYLDGVLADAVANIENDKNVLRHIGEQTDPLSCDIDLPPPPMEMLDDFADNNNNNHVNIFYSLHFYL